MKKKMAMILSLLVMAYPAPLTAIADVDQNHVVDAFDLAILKRLLIK